MKHIGTKRIETERLILRRFTLDDAGAMYRNWASDGEVTKYLMWAPHSAQWVTEKILADWVAGYERENFYQWAIVLKECGDEPIGSISVVSHDDAVKKAHVGYCLGRAWQHRGVMTEALNAVIGFLFDEVGMQRVEARHDTRNPASGAVMQRCGMQYEGTLRQADWNNQGICDASYYAILAGGR